MKASAIYLITVGVVWALAIAYMFFALSRIAEPISVVYTTFYYTALMIGPLIMIIGPILVLAASHRKLGLILSAIGCVILTVTIGYQALSGLRAESLQVKPPYGLWAGLIIMTGLADTAVWCLYRRSIRASNSP